MEYYATITNGIIDGKGQCPCSGNNTFSVEVTKEVYDNLEQYVWTGSELILNPEWDNIQLNRAKDEKIKLNDELRDRALLQGVEYQNVLFDSDTDQKTNLIGTILSMSDTDTITWFGMDNTALLCTKADLYAISDLIKELHSFCWGMNAHVKEQIAEAETVEDVESIVISYDRDDT